LGLARTLPSRPFPGPAMQLSFVTRGFKLLPAYPAIFTMVPGLSWPSSFYLVQSTRSRVILVVYYKERLREPIRPGWLRFTFFLPAGIYVSPRGGLSRFSLRAAEHRAFPLSSGVFFGVLLFCSREYQFRRLSRRAIPLNWPNDTVWSTGVLFPFLR